MHGWQENLISWLGATLVLFLGLTLFAFWSLNTFSGDNLAEVMSGVYREWAVGEVDTTTIGVYAVQYFAEDYAGNVGSGPTTTVYVQDTTPPVFIYSSPNIYVERQNESDLLFDWNSYLNHFISASDAYDSLHGFSTNLEITLPTGLSLTKVGSYPLTLFAVDRQANSTTSTAVRIIVRDTLAPNLVVSTTTDLVIISANEEIMLPDGWQRVSSTTVELPVYTDGYVYVDICDLYQHCVGKTITVNWFGNWPEPPKPPTNNVGRVGGGSRLVDHDSRQNLIDTIRNVVKILQSSCITIDAKILSMVQMPSVNCERVLVNDLQFSPSQLLAQCPNLDYNDKHSCVPLLQEYLNANNILLADKGVGAPGYETEYLCNRTEYALKRFQQSHNLATTGVLDEATKKNILQIGDFYQTNLNLNLIVPNAKIESADCPAGEPRW